MYCAALWERGWSFIKRAGTVILLSYHSCCGSSRASDSRMVRFGMVEDEQQSMLAAVGNAIAWIFAPLGFGDWKAAVASFHRS